MTNQIPTPDISPLIGMSVGSGKSQGDPLPVFEHGEKCTLKYFINGKGKLCMLRQREEREVIFDRLATPADIDSSEHFIKTIYVRRRAFVSLTSITIHHDSIATAWPGADRGVWARVILPPLKAWSKRDHSFHEASIYETFLRCGHGRWVRIEQLEKDWI